MRIFVNHNMEVAHRLLNLPGKCMQIHGHSMQVTLSLEVEQGTTGYAVNGRDEILDFGSIKRQFREYIDTTYDHHLLLNENDPWAGIVNLPDGTSETGSSIAHLPGLQQTPGDPSVENLAKWICEWVHNRFVLPCKVTIHETGTNGVEYEVL